MTFHYNYISDKKLIVVAVGATLKKVNEEKELKAKNFTEKMGENLQLFGLSGGLNYKKMNLLDRFLMFLMVAALKSKKERNP